MRSTCLDGAPWSLNNEIVSNHCSILSLGRICPHKFHSGMSPTVNFWTFVASSSWQRFSYNLAGVWNWAQHMALEAWSSSFTKHTFSPRVLDQSVALQKEWGQLSSQFGGRFLSSFLRGWANVFTSPWLGTLSTLFFDLQLRTIL